MCHRLVRKLAKHIRTKHPSYQERGAGTADASAGQVESATGQPQPAANTGSVAASRSSRAHPEKGTITRETAGLASLDADLCRAKYQSDSEDRRLKDPGREWDGSFGSLPLFDDYGDESDAEDVE